MKRSNFRGIGEHSFWQFRKGISLVAFASLLVLSFSMAISAVHAETEAEVMSNNFRDDQNLVRIIELNDEKQTDHARVKYINVAPGDDRVEIVADVLDVSNNYEPRGMEVEDFTFSSDYHDSEKTDDTCDPAHDDNCLDNSNFEVNDFGVRYYVPEKMGKEIRIEVKSRSYENSRAVVVLRNKYYVDRGSSAPIEAPTQVVSNLSEYNYSTYDHERALHGMGGWVVISGSRYWVPVHYEVGWKPYQHGYWTWNDTYGWTWTSYDPWGSVTDHYGVWRHHASYGWIWLPFHDYRYVGAAVEFFDSSEHIGWYPYHRSYERGYVHGYREGFDDGYMAGYMRAKFEDEDAIYRRGVVCVPSRSFGYNDVYSVRLEPRVSLSIYEGYRSRGVYTSYLGGNTIYESRSYVRLRVGIDLPTTQINIRIVNNIKIVTTPRVYQVPERYTVIVRDRREYKRPVAIGSVITRSNNPHDAPVIIRPTTNGRGVSHSVREKDQRSGEMVERKPRTRKVADANPQNPVYNAPRREPEKRGPEKKDPPRRESPPKKDEPVKRDPPAKRDPEKRAPEKREPEKREPEKKEPPRKEAPPKKDEPVKRDPPKQEPPAKREPEKKDPPRREAPPKKDDGKDKKKH